MTSNIDANKPTAGLATTASVRDNFASAKSEIEALQAGKQDADADLTAVAALGPSAGFLARTGSAAFATRTLTGPATGIAIGNGDGAGGNPTLTLANDLAALEGMAGVGLVVRTATDSYAQRAIAGPAAGLAVVNGDGAAGNPTLGLANDLAAIEALATTGGVERTGADAWATYTLTGAGKALLDDADTAAQRTTLGLGTAATVNTGTSGATIPLLDGMNTWSGAQTISKTGVSGDVPLRAFTTNLGNAEANDLYFGKAASANNAAIIRYTQQATASTLDVLLFGDNAGTNGLRLTKGGGVLVGTPTGASGDQGAGSVNAQALYADVATIISTDAGAGSGPFLTLARNSASPAAFDNLGQLRFQGRDSAAATALYAKITAGIVDPTAASVDGELALNTTVASVDATRVFIGAGLYTPNATGGDKGVDTINAKAVYDDNVLLTCYVLEAATHGTIDATKWDATIAPRAAGEQPAARGPAIHEPARRFAAERVGFLDPERYGDIWRAAGHLPSMPSPTEWHRRGNKLPIGEVLQRLWEAVELQAVHIDRLNQQIKTMRARP